MVALLDPVLCHELGKAADIKEENFVEIFTFAKVIKPEPPAMINVTHSMPAPPASPALVSTVLREHLCDVT